MSLTLSDLLQAHWPDYAAANRARLCPAHYRAVRRVLACRTPELGGRLYSCKGCRKRHFAYHSCNHRSCPQCGARDQQVWTAWQEARLLPVPYFMVTFTIPAELRSLCAKHPKELYDVMMKESAGALQDVIATKLKVPHARSGFTSVLHTWGREMQHHPHVHVIVPAVAFDARKDELIHPRKSGEFLVHYLPLAARFRSRMEQALREEQPEIYRRMDDEQVRALNPLKQWNVHLQAVGKGKTAVRYLARYVTKSAFHPSRLLGYDKQGRVRLACTSTTGQRKVLRLTVAEFMRRWLQHVLPKGFARIRHYGFASSAAVKTRLRIRAHLGELGEPLVQLPEQPAFACPHCGGDLVFLRELPRLQKLHPQRGPPGQPKPLPRRP